MSYFVRIDETELMEALLDPIQDLILPHRELGICTQNLVLPTSQMSTCGCLVQCSMFE